MQRNSSATAAKLGAYPLNFVTKIKIGEDRGFHLGCDISLSVHPLWCPCASLLLRSGVVIPSSCGICGVQQASSLFGRTAPFFSFFGSRVCPFLFFCEWITWEALADPPNDDSPEASSSETEHSCPLCRHSHRPCRRLYPLRRFHFGRNPCYIHTCPDGHFCILVTLFTPGFPFVVTVAIVIVPAANALLFPR